ncbi:hypothetical protein JCM11251_007056 [Rhodosporidiobolus azoricus]
MLQLALLTSSVALLAARAKADVVPTGPGPNDVFRVGETCKINWNLDTTGAWDNFSITLKTGDNLAMVELETVVSGLDGTTGTGEYEWVCPNVTPNSKIYFYEFAQAGETTSWTTRFTIAAADGSTTEPTETNAQGIAWGTGRLVGSAPAGGSSAAASSGRASASTGPSRSASADVAPSGASSGAVPTAASSSSAASSSAEEDSETSSSSMSMVTVTSTASSSSASSASSAASSSGNSLVNAAASATPSDTGNGAGRVGAGLALGLVGAALALFA